ncbi:MAG: filamentous hemagglutinin N-terminal domain-containing protein [Coleofasciculaceae cyanobacterium]
MILLTGLMVVCSGNDALAELIPDNTLGAESSLVTPNTQIRGLSTDRIDGGALRDSNLFHSFQEFNVNQGQRVYFSSPTGVENILSRVTGNNLSEIMGTLGVDGEANLFLLNPHGIVFGSEASLDVAGSFVASTANSFTFANNQFFSATDPQAAPLLTLNVTPGLQYGSNSPNSTISSTGNLEVGQDLTLAGINLNLEGQLRAGSDLNLLAENSLIVRDSVENPFIAAAGGQLLLEGSGAVDIAVLNHPDSGFFSGGNMLLRSPQTIGGDAQYNSLGNFRIEKLDGSLGNLASPGDPIIRASGDVRFDSYEGASLHILAGGEVALGKVTITGTEAVDFIAEEITLSDGQTRVEIDGSRQPTLDVRAGMNPAEISPLGLSGVFDVLVPANPVAAERSSADIQIGNVAINAPDGMVYLSNQYQADPSLPGGRINVGTIFTNDASGSFGNSGNVVIDSRGDIRVSDRIDVSSASGNSGDITLLAQDLISLNESYLISNVAGTGFQGGDIEITTGKLKGERGAQIRANTAGVNSDAGQIRITARETVSFDGVAERPNQERTRQEQRSGLVNRILEGAVGNSGGIFIKTGSLSFSNGAQMQARVEGTGTSGGITIEAEDVVSFDGVSSEEFSTDRPNTTAAISSIEKRGAGQAGDIIIRARSVRLTNGGDLQSNTIGDGDAGDVRIFAREDVLISGEGRGRESKILSRVNESGRGNGGEIYIEAGSISITDDAELRARAEGEEGENRGGDITLIARNTILLDDADVESSLDDDAAGQAGNIYLEAPFISINNDSEVSAETEGLGNGGNIRVVAHNTLFLNDESQLETATEGLGDGGNIHISAPLVTISDQASLEAATEGQGRAGNVRLEVGQLIVRDEAEITASTFGDFDAGNILVEATDSVVVTNDALIFSGVAPGATGNGGKIDIYTRSLSLTNGGRVQTGTFGDIPAVAGSQYASYNEAVQADNPVAYWRLDETGGLTAVDSVGNFNGTYRGNARAGVAGVSGAAADFDGERGAIEVGRVAAGSELDIPSQTFTVEAWIRPNDSPPREQIYFSMHSANETRQSLQLELDDDGSIDLAYFNDGLGGPRGTVEFGEGWHHVVTGYERDADGNGGVSRIYVDGFQVDGSDNDGPFEGETPNLLIGSWRDIDDQTFGGQIDEVAFYRTALSSDRVVAHYYSGQNSLGVPLRADGANAGNIRVEAETVNISGVSPTYGISSGLFSGTEGQFSGRGGNIDVRTDSLTVENSGVLSARTVNQSPGGNISVNANTVDVSGGGQLLTSAFGSGDAGTINVNANQSLTVAGSDANFEQRTAEFGAENLDTDGAASGLFANTAANSTGNGGSVAVTAGEMVVRDGARVAVNSDGTGDGGDLEVEAGSLLLDNQGRLTAETASGDGGDIILRIDDSLILRRNSEISTTAGTQGAGGNGGDIKIKAGFIIAVPGENSDIAANAFEGDGGNIDITTDGIFGIEFRPKRTPLSDITASSRFGLAGRVIINQLNIDPSRGLAELPSDLVDATKQVDRSCSANSAARRNSFVVTGRGGLPPKPTDNLESEVVVTNWVNLENEGDNTERVTSNGNSRFSSTRQIVEVQGWLKTAEGQVILTARSPEVLPSNSALSSPSCRSFPAEAD